MGEFDIALAEFYAPWCGHCKKLVPEYERAATTLQANDPPVPLVKVDCTEAGKDICSANGVSGYPTLKIFKNGEFSADYNGPRDADGIVKFMKSKAGPSAKTLASVADAEKFLSGSEYAVVGFFESMDSDLAKALKSVADALSEDTPFAITTESAVREKYGVDAGSVVMFQPQRYNSKFEEKTKTYSGASNKGALQTWVRENRVGLCDERTASKSDLFNKKPLITAYFDVDYVKNTKGTNYWRNRVMKVAQKFAEQKVSFCVANAKDFSYELEEFGMKPSEGVLVGARNAKDQKISMSGDFSMDVLETFVTDLLANKLEPHLKSEDVPEDNSAPVKVIVAKNFEEIVNDESKDVLIEFYAPWCGHCKTLAPKYDELAEQLSGESGITIAKMDATANDVPSSYDVKGFPTLYFAPAGSKGSPKKYEGGREVKDFMKYLAKEATTEMTGFDRSGKAKNVEL